MFLLARAANLKVHILAGHVQLQDSFDALPAAFVAGSDRLGS